MTYTSPGARLLRAVLAKRGRPVWTPAKGWHNAPRWPK